MPSMVSLRMFWLVLAAITAQGLAGCSASRVRVPDYVREQYGRAAYRAAGDWRTWAPLLAAAAIRVGGWDQDISDSLAGSATSPSIQAANPGLTDEEAERISEQMHGRDTAAMLSDITAGLGLASGLLTPLLQHGSVDANGCGAVAPQRKRLLTSVGTLATTVGTTLGLKALTGRMRPDGGNDESFPSGHTAVTACGSAFSRYELQRMSGWSRRKKAVLYGAYSALPLVTGYLRVRAKKHYPSDVLCGWALGNFIGSFAYESMLLPRGCQPHFTMRSARGSTTIELGLTRDF